MWNRKDIKTEAKLLFRTHFWKVFFVSLVIVIATNSSAILGGSRSRWKNINYKQFIPKTYTDKIQFNDIKFNDIKFNDAKLNEMDAGIDIWGEIWDEKSILPPGLFLGFGIAFILFIALIIFLFYTTIQVFIGTPFIIGGRKFYSNLPLGNADMNNLFFTFEKGNYLGAVKSIFLRNLFVFLWSLLFLIPGIIKHYQYSMVPYILAENPNVGARKAMCLSGKMTDGNKIRLFLFDLSFIGWYILGAIPFGLGILFFARPYEDTSKGILYLKLRDIALNKGIINGEDL